MQLIYAKGTQRIFYKAEAFNEGLTITAKFWYPDLHESGILTFTELGEGIYYLDFDFTTCGVYQWLFYENDVKKQTATVRIGDPWMYTGMVRYRT